MRPLKWLDRAVEVAAVLAFATSGLLISINVVNRYLIAGGLRQLSKQFESLKPVYLFFREWFGSVSVMADEVPGYLLVWVAFLGAYLAMRQGGHIAFDLLSTKISATGQKALASINTALILLFLTMLMWQSIRMISVSGRTEIETAEIAQGWFMAILPLAAGLLAIACIVRFREQLRDQPPNQQKA